MGDPVCGAGRYTAPTSFPVALSNARIIAPRRPLGVGPRLRSAAMSRVLVTSVPTLLPGRPSGPRFSPFRAGWLAMAGGVAPNGVIHFTSPVSMLKAVIRLYGGFMIGRPCTVNGTPALAPSCSAATAAAAAPDPPARRAPLNTVPWKYGRSDVPGGAGVKPSVAMDVCDATYSVCVSGSKEPPGQLLAAACAPIVSVAMGPSALLTEGGVKIGPSRYLETSCTASARNSGVKSMRSLIVRP